MFGGAAEPPKGGNPDSNTLISDMTTVICLDDYHSLDRTGRKEKGVTALDPRANDFDLMYEQVKALKSGIAVGTAMRSWIETQTSDGKILPAWSMPKNV